MKRNAIAAGMLALAFAFGVIHVKAKDDDVPDSKLSKFDLGKVIHGDKEKFKDLDGKVVAIEFWGIH